MINDYHYNIDINKFIQSLDLQVSFTMNDYGDYAEYNLYFVTSDGIQSIVTLNVKEKKPFTYTVIQTKQIDEKPDLGTIDQLDFIAKYFIIRADDAEKLYELNDYYSLTNFVDNYSVVINVKYLSENTIGVIINDNIFSFNLYETPVNITDIYMYINAPYDAMNYFNADYYSINLTCNGMQYSGAIVRIEEELCKQLDKVVDIQITMPANPQKEQLIETVGNIYIDEQLYANFNVSVDFLPLNAIPDYQIRPEDLYASLDDIVDKTYVINNATFYMYYLEFKVGLEIDIEQFVNENGYTIQVDLYHYDGYSLADFKIVDDYGIIVESKITIYYK